MGWDYLEPEWIAMIFWSLDSSVDRGNLSLLNRDWSIKVSAIVLVIGSGSTITNKHLAEVKRRFPALGSLSVGTNNPGVATVLPTFGKLRALTLAIEEPSGILKPDYICPLAALPSLDMLEVVILESCKSELVVRFYSLDLLTRISSLRLKGLRCEHLRGTLPLGNLAALKTLCVDCEWAEDDMFFPCLHDLPTGLQSLELKGGGFNDENLLSEGGQGILTLPCLTKLHLEYSCNLEGRWFHPWLAGDRFSSSLRELKVADCPFDSKYLDDCVPYLTNLTLNRTDFDQESVDALARLTAFRVLNLEVDSNFLQGPVDFSAVAGLQGLTKLGLLLLPAKH